jgi:hypothetical protein
MPEASLDSTFNTYFPLFLLQYSFLLAFTVFQRCLNSLLTPRTGGKYNIYEIATSETLSRDERARIDMNNEDTPSWNDILSGEVDEVFR